MLGSHWVNNLVVVHKVVVNHQVVVNNLVVHKVVNPSTPPG